MDVNNKNTTEPDPYFDEIKSRTNVNFDFVLWFYRILKYWYLFVISIAIFLTYATFKNKEIIPVFSIQAVLILDDKNAASVVSGAVPTATLLQNTENQQIVLKSHQLAKRTVENLPSRMRVDYFFNTRFRRYSLYTDTPVRVDSIIGVSPEAYNYIYDISYIDENNCEISYKEHPEESPIRLKVPFDQIIDYKLFKIRLTKTSAFVPGIGEFKPDMKSFNFQFLSNDHLIGMFYGRIQPRMVDANATILNITMTGPDPQRDIDYLSVLLEEFQKYNLDLKNQQATMTINFLDNQLKQIGVSLDSSRMKLENFQRTTGVYEITSHTLMYALDSANRERDALAIKERSILALTEKIKETIMESEEIINPVNFNINNPRLILYITEYNELMKRYKNLGDRNPLYNNTVDELNDYRSKILTEVQSIQRSMQEQKDALVRKYLMLDARMDNLPPQERDLVKFQNETRTYEVYQQYMTRRRQEADIQRSSNQPDNEILEPPRQISGNLTGGAGRENYIFYLIIGLVLPLGFVIIKEELLNFTIATKEECEKISGFPVIGTIENISKKLSNGVVLVKNYPKSSFAESFRNMRVRIEYMAQRESKISVLVTSTEPADGKTFIATNVASVYQLMGKKVLLIDFDLRRPSVAKTLQISTQKGLSNYLIGQVELEDIIITHPDYGFDIIPAGTLPPNPSELIKTVKTKETIEYLKTIYDYIVIDCSPVGLVSDAYILSEMVDTLLYVVRRAKTNRAFFKSVINQLKFDGIENIALVFNDVKGREGYYGTSRYYVDKTYYLRKNSYYHDDYFEN